MLDPKEFRQELDSIVEALKKRGLNLDTEQYQRLEAERKSLQVQTEDLQNQRKKLSKRIGQAKAKGEPTEALMEEVEAVGEQLQSCAVTLDQLQQDLQRWFLDVPNVPHDSVPSGNDESDNIVQRQVGTIRSRQFPVKDHVELAQGLDGVDFEAATQLSGARFAVMKGDVARLHRVLIQFMMDVHTQDHGYQEVYVPYLVQPDILQGTGQLPKFSEDLFKIEGDRELYLIPTAEVPVTNLCKDRIVPVDELPLKFVAHTPCFRSEAGSYGKDTKGLFRQHQFEKVELVQLVRPETSYEQLEQLLGHAESILQRLELPYRVVALCGGDLGFSSAKTYDLEVWLPGQEAYREISSCSNFEDFQARRMQARYRNAAMKKPALLHTLNGSGLAIGRTLIAVLENHQQADGSIAIPGPLQPYLHGLTHLHPKRG